MEKEEVKKRITKKDWKNVEEFILDELKTREKSEMRKRHSRIWKTVDRQVIMEPMSRVKRDSNAVGDWRNALELGELSRASEVIAADIRRLTFPQTRSWFDPHSEIDPDAMEPIDPAIQNRIDGRQRAFMTQQHIDFGFKSRIDLSVKEALHHGSYVATMDWETDVQVSGGTGIKALAAPVWNPHSMWNCFPDPSVGGNNTFYQGSMIIRRYKKDHEVRRMKSPNSEYPFFNLNKIEKKTNRRNGVEDTEDVELVYYYGDIVIPRAGSDILLLNSRAILANERIIHYMPNPFPYSPIIYNGWERLDVRDPYYVSPLVKFSVSQTMGSILASRLMDAIDLKVEPPIVYDGNDPDFILNGGPDISPGAKVSTKGTADFKTMDVGDPTPALAGLQFIIGQIEAGTKVDRVRSGVSPGTEQTATEVIKQSQNSELSTIDFVDKHESHGLRPALYMQDHLNRKNLNTYQFYNQEMDAPDFEVMKRNQLPDNVHYEIVGSKGLLGEEQRQARTSQVTAFWMGTAPQLLNVQELVKEMYRDAGNKSPEKFMAGGTDEDVPAFQVEQMVQQAVQQALEQQAAEFQQSTEMMKAQAATMKAQSDAQSVQIDQFNAETERMKVEAGILESQANMEAKQGEAALKKYEIDVNAKKEVEVKRIEAENAVNEPIEKPEKEEAGDVNVIVGGAKKISINRENGQIVGATVEDE